MGSTWYEIRILGILGEEWAEWFSGMSIRHTGTGETILSGQLADQAALHGCLERIRNLNLTLISINRTDPSDAEAAPRGNQGA